MNDPERDEPTDRQAPRPRASSTAVIVTFTMLATWITAIYAGLIWFLRKGED